MAALEQPKRSTSAYWIWLGENRESMQKEISNTKVSELSKFAGKQWSAMSSEQKARYEQKAADAKAAYEKAMEEYKAQGGVVARRAAKAEGKDAGPAGGKTRGGAGRDDEAPKRPNGGAYGRFLADKRAEIKATLPAEHKMTDVSKKAAELWRAVSEEEKSKYEKAYEMKMEEYRAALEEYKKSNPGQVTTPKKKRGTASITAADSPAAKRSKAKASRPAQTGAGGCIELDVMVVAEALKLGEEYERNLRSLAGRDDVKASGKTAQQMLAALKGANGLLHPARRALLGA